MWKNQNHCFSAFTHDAIVHDAINHNAITHDAIIIMLPIGSLKIIEKYSQQPKIYVICVFHDTNYT